MKNSVISALQKMIDVNTPIIYINDYDFARGDNIIYRAIQNKKVYEWNPVTGRTNFFNKESEGLGAAQTLENFLHTELTRSQARWLRRSRPEQNGGRYSTM